VLTYEITELAPPPEAAGPDWEYAFAINASGAVAGGAGTTSSSEAILWNSADAPLVIEQDESSTTGAAGLNDGGVTVGAAYLESSIRAFLYSGGLTDLGPIVGGEMSSAIDINNQGLVVGGAGGGGLNDPMHGFAYDSNSGSLTTIDPLPGHTAALASAVNDVGHTIGWSGENRAGLHSHLFINRNGAPEDLGEATWSGDINDQDVITGARIFPSSPIASAFRLNADATDPGADDLGPSLPSGFAGSAGFGINNDDTIVGWALDADNNPHAMINFASGPDAGWHDLNDVVVDGEGWHLAHATAINDRGQIVGHGLHHRRARAFLLSPLTFNAGDDKIANVLLGAILLFGGAPFGAPGTLITGGGHPVPIGPQEFARLWRRLSAEERDAYIGLAIQNLGGMVANRENRAEVERVAVQIVERASREA
jgi:hypothetical protein